MVFEREDGTVQEMKQRIVTRARPAIICAALVLGVLLTASCNPSGGEVTLQLDCFGDEVVDAQPVERSVNRGYQFDRRESALLIRGLRTHRFATWGMGQVDIDGKSAAFAGEIRSTDGLLRMKREIKFDRSTKQIHDHIEGSWGTALEFKGTCEER